MTVETRRRRPRMLLDGRVRAPADTRTRRRLAKTLAWEAGAGVGAAVVLLCAALVSVPQAHATCGQVNLCSGHGTCDSSDSTCTCFEGWGASTDITLYRAADCSARVCPSGKAWGDLPTTTTTAHAVTECSGRGLCDRDTGKCVCFDGFEGDACQRNSCPSDCSGHGQCLSMKQMATFSNALPLSNVTTYTGNDDSTTWDEEKIYGCVCDSSWTVGLGSGETQVPEWFGPDCSLRHCPSGDDPMTTDTDETDCAGVKATGLRGKGLSGNLCQVDCSNRGLCDYRTGECTCFPGFYGEACGTQSALATYT